MLDVDLDVAIVVEGAGARRAADRCVWPSRMADPKRRGGLLATVVLDVRHAVVRRRVNHAIDIAIKSQVDAHPARSGIPLNEAAMVGLRRGGISAQGRTTEQSRTVGMPILAHPKHPIAWLDDSALKVHLNECVGKDG